MISRTRTFTKMVYDCALLKNSIQLRKLSHKTDDKTSFQDALKVLNSLQTNFSLYKESIAKKNESDIKHMIETKKYLERLDVEFTDFENLPIIHVAGTKGKGSTCAFTESILRSFGLRTGFFSSPHLVSVTERIRLNGEPICTSKFSKYFWFIHNKLYANRENPDDLPAYFKFLTVMAFYVFLQEKVDVAIFEVGIGGQYDPTNILSKVSTVGITSLGLEHTQLLGDTLEEIAWQKAGIIKPTSFVFTVDQPEECMDVIRNRSLQNDAQLHKVPYFNEYLWNRSVNLSINHEIQKINASLAIQLAYDWIKLNFPFLPSSVQNKTKFLENFQRGNTLTVCDEVIFGLENCKWLGRCQYLELNNLKFYLDGAHTAESIHICIDWFGNEISDSVNPRCLIFNLTGDREYEKILQIINSRMNFNRIYFVPNIPFKKVDYLESSSNFINGLENDEQIKKCIAHEVAWNSVCNDKLRMIENGGVQNVKPRINRAMVLDSIASAIDHIQKEYVNSDIDILVTGSLHLIGASLIYIDDIKKNNI